MTKHIAVLGRQKGRATTQNLIEKINMTPQDDIARKHEKNKKMIFVAKKKNGNSFLSLP